MQSLGNRDFTFRWFQQNVWEENHRKHRLCDSFQFCCPTLAANKTWYRSFPIFLKLKKNLIYHTEEGEVKTFKLKFCHSNKMWKYMGGGGIWNTLKSRIVYFELLEKNICLMIFIKVNHKYPLIFSIILCIDKVILQTPWVLLY